MWLFVFDFFNFQEFFQTFDKGRDTDATSNTTDEKHESAAKGI